MRSVFIQRVDIASKDRPERADEFAADESLIQKLPNAGKTVGMTPDARRQPGKKPQIDKLLEPSAKRSDVRRRTPCWSMTGGTYDKVNSNTLGCVCVGNVKGRFAAAKHDNRRRGADSIGMVQEVLAVENRSIKVRFTFKLRDEWL